MNDSEHEFVKMIDNMEREVLDLKTAHQRPLGTLNFFSKNIDFNIDISAGVYGVMFNVIVEIVKPTAKPPIVQLGWEIPSGFYDVSILDTNTNGDYTIWTYKLGLFNNGSAETVNFKVGAISAQPIDDIYWSYA